MYMAKEYTGTRKPRDNDAAKWQKYFEINPEKKDEYPEEYKSYVGQKSEEDLPETPETLNPPKSKVEKEPEKTINEIKWKMPNNYFPYAGGIKIERLSPEENEGSEDFKRRLENYYVGVSGAMRKSFPGWSVDIQGQDKIVMMRNGSFHFEHAGGTNLYTQKSKPFYERARKTDVKIKPGTAFYSAKFYIGVTILSWDEKTEEFLIQIGGGNIAKVQVTTRKDLEKMDLHTFQTTEMSPPSINTTIKAKAIPKKR